jgi:hypothetical protein
LRQPLQIPDTERRSKTEEESNPIVGDILGGGDKRDPPTIDVGAALGMADVL